ncbi:hypothetical protein ACFV98_30115 [Streptomyces violascens]
MCLEARDAARRRGGAAFDLKSSTNTPWI